MIPPEAVVVFNALQKLLDILFNNPCNLSGIHAGRTGTHVVKGVIHDIWKGLDEEE